MISDACPPAVILGMSPTGLAVARALGRKGVHVIAIDPDRWAIGRFSKYTKFVTMKKNNNWEEILFQTLQTIGLRYQDRPVLFCTDDASLYFLAKYADKLWQNYRLPSSLSRDNICLFLDKENLYKTCFEHRVDLPATYFPKDLGQVEDLVEILRFPCIIKPCLGHLWRKRLRGKKVVEVYNAHELIAQYIKLSSWDSKLIIQEVIPGGDGCIYVFGGCFDRNSQPVAVFTGRKLRQFPPGFGSASFVESVWEPEVVDMSVSLLKRLKFHGICGVEFKKDPRDGKFKLIEISARPDLWFSIIEASGVDLIYSVYQELIDSQMPWKQTQRNGIRWVYLERDIISSIYYLLHRALSLRNWLSTLGKAKAYAIYARDDIKVMLFLPFSMMKEFWQYLIVRR
jgi:predicted ATP-grasp superfamily ATP-dependent carboligase